MNCASARESTSIRVAGEGGGSCRLVGELLRLLSREPPLCASCFASIGRCVDASPCLTTLLFGLKARSSYVLFFVWPSVHPKCTYTHLDTRAHAHTHTRAHMCTCARMPTRPQANTEIATLFLRLFFEVSSLCRDRLGSRSTEWLLLDPPDRSLAPAPLV